MVQKKVNDTALGAIILAAGMGTRMRSNLHKVLHPIANIAMIRHLLNALDALNVAKRVVVVGKAREQVEKAISGVEFAIQHEQLGTGHAVLSAKDAFANFAGNILILYGDVPLVSSETMSKLIEELHGDDKNAAVVLGFEPENPSHYGRLVVNDDGSLNKIVEFKDASSSERAIKLCNSGIMVVRSKQLFALLETVGNNNAAGEYYLTDLVAAVGSAGYKTGVLVVEENQVKGVNSRFELAEVERVFQQNARRTAMENGVTLLDPESVYFSHDTKIAPDVTIAQNVVFGPGVEIKTGATIHPFSHLEGCSVGENASVGPFARLRPGANLGEKVKIGNFVEVKKSEIEKGAKVSHLSYIGDSVVGEGANIGAGTITCNYDGFNKFKTLIGKGAFIGSNTSLVAPVSVGDGATVGAGSVITSDVEADALAVERSKQRMVSGWSAQFRQKQKEKK